MAVRRAFACAVALPLLAGCGDNTGPGPSTPAGLWSLSFEGPLHDIAGTVIGTCHSEFVVKIAEVSSDPRYRFEARVPVAAHPICNDEPSLRAFPSVIMVIRQDGDQVTFLADGVDVLVTATYRGGSMAGTVPDRHFEYVGSNFQATRLLSSTDPNEAPATIRVELGRPDLAVGDSLLVIGSVKTGYGDRVLNQDVVWSSSDPAVVGVESRGEDESYGAAARLLGLKPGTAFVTARSGALADSLQLTVFVPR